MILGWKSNSINEKEAISSEDHLGIPENKKTNGTGISEEQEKSHSGTRGKSTAKEATPGEADPRATEGGVLHKHKQLLSMGGGVIT